jgi:hypothetical protein
MVHVVEQVVHAGVDYTVQVLWVMVLWMQAVGVMKVTYPLSVFLLAYQ